MRRIAGVTIFCERRLQHLLVQQRVREQLLESRVLVLERTQPLGLADLHAAELLTPAVDGLVIHPELAGDVCLSRAAVDLA